MPKPISDIFFQFLDQPQTYSGKELRPHWVLEKTGNYGSGIAVFQGACKVPTENLVDWEDKLARDFIEARSMLHFIGEFFEINLHLGIAYQRLFMVWAERILKKFSLQGGVVERSGDDLFWIKENKRLKMSVSIATVSPVSCLIHWGINLESQGSPVPAVGLKDLGLNETEVLSFAKELLERYIFELEEIKRAQFKVKPVGMGT